MCCGLAEMKDDTNQDHIDHVVVGHLSMNIVSLNIIQVFLDGTCLLEIPDLVKSPVWLIVVKIVFPHNVLDFLPSIEPMLVRLRPFQYISFRT